MKNANEKNPQTKTPNSRLKDPLLDCLKLLEMQFPQILLDYSDIDSGVLLALSATQKSTLLATHLCAGPETRAGNGWSCFVFLPLPWPTTASTHQ